MQLMLYCHLFSIWIIYKYCDLPFHFQCKNLYLSFTLNTRSNCCAYDRRYLRGLTRYSKKKKQQRSIKSLIKLTMINNIKGYMKDVWINMRCNKLTESWFQCVSDLTVLKRCKNPYHCIASVYDSSRKLSCMNGKEI